MEVEIEKTPFNDKSSFKSTIDELDMLFIDIMNNPENYWQRVAEEL